MERLIVIDKPEDLGQVLDFVKESEFVAFDTETNGTHRGAQVIGLSLCGDESTAYYIILKAWDVTTEQLITVIPDSGIAEILQLLTTKQLVGHNAIFDCSMIEQNFKISLIDSIHTDTMILAHILNENRRVGLKELAAHYFGESSTVEQKEMKESITKNGGKMTKTQYDLYKADAHLIAKYGAKDALLTYKLFLQLVPELYEQGLDKFFYEEESMPLLKTVTYQLNTTGLKVDVPALQSLKKTLEAECIEAKAYILDAIKPHISEKYPGTNKKNQFNIGSSQQLSELIFGIYQLEFNTLTDAGKELCRSLNVKIPYSISAKRQFIQMCLSRKGEPLGPDAVVNGKTVKAKKIKAPWAYIACDKKTLTGLAHRYKWIERLLEYQRKMKILSTYVEGIEERLQYGVIRPSFLQHGTTSGRYASRDPNFQNLPRDDKRVKSCIIARPGKVFVGADYSQLEPRVFAYYSKDERLLASFGGEDDFYSVIGMEVYNKHDCVPRKEGSPDAFGIKYKKLRDLSKVIALASTYGATAHQLAPTTGKSREDTQEDIDAYFERFPGVAELMKESHKLAKDNGYVTNLFGRPRRMPEALKIRKIYGEKSHVDYPYEVRNILNLAVNHRIQSTGASIVNRSAVQFLRDCQDAGIECRLVVQVHDSLVVECDEKDAENVSLLLQNAMENTVDLKTVRLEAVPKIGKNLAEV
jgi:DNA polymerase-1